MPDAEALLVAAVSNDQVSIVRLLLERKADVDAPADGGDTPLIAALGAGSYPGAQSPVSMVKLLSLHKADPNRQNENGDTALILASFKGHLDVVHALVKAKARPDLRNNLGNTALMQAVTQGHDRIVRALLDARADFRPHNKQGMTALTPAASRQIVASSWISPLGTHPTPCETECRSWSGSARGMPAFAMCFWDDSGASSYCGVPGRTIDSC